MKKLLENGGETLIESLVGILVVALVMLFLSTAVATAARINHKVRNTDVAFVSDDEGTTQKTAQVTFTPKDGSAAVTGNAQVLTTKNGYTYYRYVKETTP